MADPQEEGEEGEDVGEFKDNTRDDSWFPVGASSR